MRIGIYSLHSCYWPVALAQCVRQIPGAELVMLPKTGHASFYERPALFTGIMMGFLNLQEEIVIN